MSNEITKTLNEVFVDMIQYWCKVNKNLTDIHVITIPATKIGKIRLRNEINKIRKDETTYVYEHRYVATEHNKGRKYIKAMYYDILNYLADPKRTILGFEFITNKITGFKYCKTKDLGLWIICTNENNNLQYHQPDENNEESTVVKD